ncbi:MAG: beta-ketoacyl synthase N-terminal-like domain-containing protein, partial [Pseudomonadota bacterium]
MGFYGPGAGADGVVRLEGDEFREGSTALSAFRRLLREGGDAIREIPPERWDWRDPSFFEPDKAKAVSSGRSYARWGGFLEGGIDRFDALFFGISPREAELMDPQERLFLEVAWHAVEDAGLSRTALAGRRIGVFAGAMFGHYQLYESPSGIANSSFASIANRVSHVFDWRGPSLAVDTMCSSSLAAIALACASLRRGESEMALAGGVNLITHKRRYALLSQGRFAATDGRCRAFGEGGDGYVPGEGAGAVLLKPLAAAEADGDPIWGVIAGIGTNHGGRSAGSGFTVPSPAAQGEAIRAALDEAGVGAETISYVEAHGTGTALGDPVELVGLARGYGDGASRGRPIALGAVKSNIGHLEAAAGIAGLVKVLLGLRHGELVPSLPHSDGLNPECDFRGAGFRLQQECAPWVAGDGPRRAGLSAFGAGGSNVHMIVEEAPARAVARAVGQEVPVMVPLSAPSVAQLRASAHALAAWVEAQGGVGAASAQETVCSVAAEVLSIPRAAIEPDDSIEDCGFDATTGAALSSHLLDLFPDAELPRFLASGLRLADIAALLDPSPGEGLSLPNLAATLQLGREAFTQRAAFVVSSVGELKAALMRFAQTGEGLCGTAPDTEDIGRSEEVGLSVDGRDVHALARLWVSGANVPFAKLCNNPLRRLSVPGLAFRQTRHWLLPEMEPHGGTGHLLVGKNASGWDGLSVDLRLGEVPFLREHVVRGTAILPASALPEITVAAMETLGAPPVAALREVVWHRALPVARSARLRLVRDGDA